MTELTAIFDHVARSLETLLSQFDDSPAFRAFVEALVNQVQDLEDAAIDVLSTTLDVAVGDALDQYGLLVGVRRDGLNDDEYRKLILVRIRANRSNGNPDVIAGILATLTGVPVRYELLAPAAYALHYEVSAATSAVCRARWKALIEEITPAGVELSEIRENTPGAFGFEGDPTSEPFGIGFFTTEFL